MRANNSLFSHTYRESLEERLVREMKCGGKCNFNRKKNNEIFFLFIGFLGDFYLGLFC